MGFTFFYTRENLANYQQDVFATGLQQACQQVVTMLIFYQVATRLSLTTCWQIVELQDDNKSLEQLVTSLLSSTTLQQVVNKLGTSSANTSCWQVVGTALLQVCCRFVTTCAFLRAYTYSVDLISSILNHRLGTLNVQKNITETSNRILGKETN
jgi:hypothetical protein